MLWAKLIVGQNESGGDGMHPSWLTAPYDKPVLTSRRSADAVMRLAVNVRF